MEALKELDARTATVEEVMQTLDIPREEAEYLLHEMRGEYEPDIILVPGGATAVDEQPPRG